MITLLIHKKRYQTERLLQAMRCASKAYRDARFIVEEVEGCLARGHVECTTGRHAFACSLPRVDMSAWAAACLLNDQYKLAVDSATDF